MSYYRRNYGYRGRRNYGYRRGRSSGYRSTYNNRRRAYGSRGYGVRRRSYNYGGRRF